MPDRHAGQGATASKTRPTCERAIVGTEAYQAVVIGSGSGGAVAALRLRENGVKTVVLERGRSWAISPNEDTFCTYRKPDGPSSSHREVEWSLAEMTREERKSLLHFQL